MIDNPYGIQFGPPELTTVKGRPMQVQSGEPTNDFWTAWKGNKANVRAQGMSVRKDESTGQFVVKKWSEAGNTTPQPPVQNHGTAAFDADVPFFDNGAGNQYPEHPNSGSFMTDDVAQVNPALVPPNHPQAPYEGHGHRNQAMVHNAARSVGMPMNEPSYRAMDLQSRLIHKMRIACEDALAGGLKPDRIAAVIDTFQREFAAKG